MIHRSAGLFRVAVVSILPQPLPGHGKEDPHRAQKTEAEKISLGHLQKKKPGAGMHEGRRRRTEGVNDQGGAEKPSLTDKIHACGARPLN